MIKRLGLAALFLLSFPAFSGEISTVTLDNGAKVWLKDDFTWEYVILTEQPVVQNSQSTTQTTATPALTAAAMTQSALLSTAALDGVKVSFTESKWEDGKLGLNFDLHSTTSKNIVVVDIEVTLFDDSGKHLKKEVLTVWQAQYRLPETYLREGEQRPSRTLWVEGIDQSSWGKQLLSLKVIEVKAR
ncbi:DUF3157 family protein [Psychromonas aquimarina]|uniref:DUF3157 family protein n=1 Tax=Psychromonas aquimarina TaxID=444919 RepID=UPI0004035282|nr:DUF3157 family protein [Psychromonas aquimarina]